MDGFKWLPGDQVEWDCAGNGPTLRAVVVDDKHFYGPIVEQFFSDRTLVRLDDESESLVNTARLRFAVPPGTYEAICAALCAGPECASDLPHRPFWHKHQAHRIVAAMARLGAIQHTTKEMTR